MNGRHSFGAPQFGSRLGEAHRVPLRRSFIGQGSGPDATCVRVTTVKSAGTIISTITERYQIRGYQIYGVPTGEVVDSGMSTEFQVVDIWACPPGMKPPGFVAPPGKPDSEIPAPGPTPEPTPAPGSIPALPEASDDMTGLAVTGGILAAVAAAFALS